MPDFLISLIAVVVILGFMILIHEFGHYAVAKWLGVRVEVFSIGFGKRLLGFRKGDTDYRISAIPLGGYVKMSGENPMDERSGDPARVSQSFALAPFSDRHRRPHDEHYAGHLPAYCGVYMVHYEYPAIYDEPHRDRLGDARHPLRQGRLSAGRSHRPHRRHTESDLGAG